jgi:DMSO/TMAO reductase YedYZ heme-binding membrane subunit
MARASGIVTWGFLMASALWGILLATRVLKPYDRPAWLLDLHSWLGAITVFGTGLHLASLVGDRYVHFGTADLFVPFATSWKPLAVAWGIIGMYLLVAVQGSSWLMKKLPKKLWRSIHLSSYALFTTVSIHAFAAGTDRANHFFQAFGVAIITVVLGATAIRVMYAGQPKTRQVISADARAASSVKSVLPPPQVQQ